MAQFRSTGNRIARRMAAQRWLLPVLIFVLALAPRLVGLSAFLTADEDDQLKFAAAFLQAVLRHDWGGMLVLGYPGVPTMALGALGLWLKYNLTAAFAPTPISPLPTPFAPDVPFAHHVFLPLIERAPQLQGIDAMLATVLRQPLDFIVAVRLPMVLTAAVAVVLIFFLLRKLLPEKIAVWATLLVAFDPFFLANSRVIHVDAPLTYFMFAAFLAFLVYLKNGRWQYLLASGLLGGLAALSKTPALTLAPILLAGGWLFIRRQSDSPAGVKRWALALVAWGAILFAAFMLFWPSMWAKPLFAVTWIFKNILSAAGAPHPSSGLFWGVLVTDRSPWYYAVAVPFLLTPLTTVGAVLGGIFALRDRKRSVHTVSLAWALVAFILIFLIAVSIPARRLVRYTLPIFPALDVLAALGLAWLAARLRSKWGDILLAAVIFIQIGQVLL
ncbi:MAG TPA: phospholipid carrier-dependent glycosyltransferase, partial [Anaerolineae bacterium]|nr:phospholipid carrier-dependent glycosyltransferase [Anaerolineae bacterium]